MEADEYLVVWTVYDSPADYPGLFVARKWRIKQGEVIADTVVTAESLQEVRGLVPRGLHLMPRAPEDDAKIVESWL